MKTLKSTLQIGFILMFFFLAGNVQAQVQSAMSSSPEAMASQQTKYEADQLQLDAKEAIDLAQVNLLYAQQMTALRKKANDESSKTEIEALKRSHTNKIRSLLSSEKYRKYLELKKMEDDAEKKKSEK